jgi:hypothetical protein
MQNKNLNFFKEKSLIEIINSFFKNQRVLVTIWENGNTHAGFAEIIIDDHPDNNIGFFVGEECVASANADDILKLIDYDTFKIIKSKNNNEGIILRFFTLSNYDFTFKLK